MWIVSLNNMEKLNDPKILRIVTIVVLLNAILVSFSQILLVVSTIMKEKSPLVPEALSSFMIFPIYFLFPLFIGIIFYCSRSLLQKTYDYKIVLWLAVFSILYFAFGGELYAFIQSFHSYAP